MTGIDERTNADASPAATTIGRIAASISGLWRPRQRTAPSVRRTSTVDVPYCGTSVRVPVPSWATIARIDATGGAGGASCCAPGGAPTHLSGTLPVRAGQSLRVAPGQRGRAAEHDGTVPGCTGGWGYRDASGGCASAHAAELPSGGGGGGATVLLRDDLVLLVAAGGGGAGSCAHGGPDCDPPHGGAGGSDSRGHDVPGAKRGGTGGAMAGGTGMGGEDSAAGAGAGGGGWRGGGAGRPARAADGSERGGGGGAAGTSWPGALWNPRSSLAVAGAGDGSVRVVFEGFGAGTH